MDERVKARIDDLEKRMQRAIDELDIIKLLARYGPAVDTADQAAYSRLFTEDGVIVSSVNGTIPQQQIMSGEMHGRMVAPGQVPSLHHRDLYLAPGRLRLSVLSALQVPGLTAHAVTHLTIDATRDVLRTRRDAPFDAPRPISVA